MTPPDSDRPRMPASLAHAPVFPPPRPAVRGEEAAVLAAQNAALNESHAMADYRARGGALVRGIEERRRRLVASRVLRARPRTNPDAWTVVDVGCEDGWIAEAYAPRVRETILVDLDPAMLRRAEAKGLPRTRCVVGDATDPWVLPPATADVLVLSAVLEHLARPAEALRALARAVRPGGRVVAFVPADGPILAIKKLLHFTGLSVFARGVSMEPAPGHLQRFDRASFADLMRSAGDVEEVSFDPLVLGYVAVARVRS